MSRNDTVFRHSARAHVRPVVVGGRRVVLAECRAELRQLYIRLSAVMAEIRAVRHRIAELE